MPTKQDRLAFTLTASHRNGAAIIEAPLLPPSPFATYTARGAFVIFVSLTSPHRAQATILTSGIIRGPDFLREVLAEGSTPKPIVSSRRPWRFRVAFVEAGEVFAVSAAHLLGTLRRTPGWA